MKARKLNKILNNPGYIIADYGEYIGIGSSMCHDLIKLDEETLNIKYALDTFREGRKALKNVTLLFIWDTLIELIENGEIEDILFENDEMENPLPVYTFEDGELVKSFTDKYGWPNTTFDGKLMYNNTHFKTPAEAIEQGIKEYTASLEWAEKSKSQKENELHKIKDRIETLQEYITNLEKTKL